MALSFGFYNAVNHDRRYDAIQMSQIFDGIISDGVYATYKKALMVKASSVNGQVIVQPGRAWFDHTWTYNDANLPIEAPASEVVLDRIDALVLDIDQDLAKRENTLVWVKGTPASRDPARPSMIKTATHTQYPLCYCYRRADNEEIRQQDITNAIGTSETPFVTGIIDHVSIDELLLQWSSEFNTYMANKRTEFETYMNDQETAFFTWMEDQTAAFETFRNNNYTAWTNWFTHLRDELDSNQAAHLQDQIDHISYMYVIDNVLYLPNTAASVSDNKLILTNHN